MRLMNLYQIFSRFSIALVAIVLIISVPMSSAYAMVIAPSKIVTIDIDELNKKKWAKTDSDKTDDIDTPHSAVHFGEPMHELFSQERDCLVIILTI